MLCNPICVWWNMIHSTLCVGVWCVNPLDDRTQLAGLHLVAGTLYHRHTATAGRNWLLQNPHGRSGRLPVLHVGGGRQGDNHNQLSNVRCKWGDDGLYEPYATHYTLRAFLRWRLNQIEQIIWIWRVATLQALHFYFSLSYSEIFQSWSSALRRLTCRVHHGWCREIDFIIFRVSKKIMNDHSSIFYDKWRSVFCFALISFWLS